MMLRPPAGPTVTADAPSFPAARALWLRSAPGILEVASIGLLVGLAIVLRLPYLHVPLGPDEGGDAWVARQWDTARGSIYGGQWLDRPPLLIVLYRLAVSGGAYGVRVLGAIAAAILVVVVVLLARRLGGRAAGLVAGLLCAFLTGSAAIAAVFAPAELLASVPASASILALAVHASRGRLRWLVWAGLAATAAALIKQSFLDAGLAGAMYLAALTVTGRSRGGRAWLAYLAGVLLALAPVALWTLTTGPSPRALLDALFGFRLTSLSTLGTDTPLTTRLGALGGPVLDSGLIALVPLAVLGLWRLRSEPALLAAFIGWLAGALIGVLAGGSYWPHYVIQLVAFAAVGTALLLTALPARVVAVLVVAVAVAGGASSVQAARHLSDHPRRTRDTQIAAWIRTRAQPSDTFYALYARANLNEAIGLRTPFPYSWSLMTRARPDARPRLLALLASSQRPTWIVRWQPPGLWGLDRNGAVRRLLRADYRRVARIGGKAILLRRDLRRSLAPR